MLGTPIRGRKPCMRRPRPSVVRGNAAHANPGPRFVQRRPTVGSGGNQHFSPRSSGPARNLNSAGRGNIAQHTPTTPRPRGFSGRDLAPVHTPTPRTAPLAHARRPFCHPTNLAHGARPLITTVPRVQPGFTARGQGGFAPGPHLAARPLTPQIDRFGQVTRAPMNTRRLPTLVRNGDQRTLLNVRSTKRQEFECDWEPNGR